MRSRLLALVIALALIAVACGSSGAPESFEEQTGPLPDGLQQYASELLSDVNPEQVPLVQRNFLEGCMLGAVARLDGLSGSDLAAAVTMKRFHRLVRRMPTGEARRQADLWTRERYAHPAHWASFALFGDYR